MSNETSSITGMTKQEALQQTMLINTNNDPKIDNEGYTCCPWCGSYQFIDNDRDTGRCSKVGYECEDCYWTYEGLG